MRNPNSYRHILKTTTLFGGVQSLNILMGVVRTKLVAVLLGTTGMGVLSMCNTWVSLLSDTLGLGLPMSAVKQLSSAYEQPQPTAFLQQLCTLRTWTLLAAGLAFAVSFFGALLWHNASWLSLLPPFALVALAVVVPMTVLTAGEMAVLKATRQLKAVAKLSVWNMLLMVIVSTIGFYQWGLRAIVPVLLVAACVQMLLVVGCSCRRFGYKVAFSKDVLRRGWTTLRLGLAFVAAGMVANGAAFLVRWWLQWQGDVHVVGLYNAATMLAMTYAGVVFHAMETDYFPRLSGVSHTGNGLNLLVNRQINACILLLSPLLLGFMMALPWLIPLLFSQAFLPMMGMMRGCLVAMFFRIFTLSIEYIALSRGHSVLYLVQEGASAVLLVAAVATGFALGGLTFVGYAIALATALEALLVLILTHHRYHFMLHRATWRWAGVQFLLLLVTLWSCLWRASPAAWALGWGTFGLSCTVSWRCWKAFHATKDKPKAA